MELPKLLLRCLVAGFPTYYSFGRQSQRLWRLPKPEQKKELSGGLMGLKPLSRCELISKSLAEAAWARFHELQRRDKARHSLDTRPQARTVTGGMWQVFDTLQEILHSPQFRQQWEVVWQGVDCSHRVQKLSDSNEWATVNGSVRRGHDARVTRDSSVRPSVWYEIQSSSFQSTPCTPSFGPAWVRLRSHWPATNRP